MGKRNLPRHRSFPSYSPLSQHHIKFIILSTNLPSNALTAVFSHLTSPVNCYPRHTFVTPKVIKGNKYYPNPSLALKVHFLTC